MTTFAEFTEKLHAINDLILSNMKFENKDYYDESQEFRAHLFTTKIWFSRTSWANKKRFVLALLAETKSIWATSLLLKATWNCRPKDAVLSVCQSRIWSGYDQVPMDNNRTALPLSALREAMRNDRMWFLTLEPQSQALYLSELLRISGGPIMWEVLQSAQGIYEMYLETQLTDLQECNLVSEPAADKVKPAPEPLDASLAAWSANLKTIRDRMKLEELEMLFSDGSKKKVWKINRVKPEAMETVDFIQLLPSEIGKMILIYLPATQLIDCARVNKYWSYMVDELRLELTARQKINVELEKLKDIVMRHDSELRLLSRPEFQLFVAISNLASTTQCSRFKNTRASLLRPNTDKHAPKQVKVLKGKVHAFSHQKRIRNLKELNERLERRGAVDENLWKWCENILIDNKQITGEKKIKQTEGLISLSPAMRFECPLMKQSLTVSLKLPLIKDPVRSTQVRTTLNFSVGDFQNVHEKKSRQCYSLWSKDLSGLYPVCKLPSYQFPF